MKSLNSWKHPRKHFSNAIDSEWYQLIAKMYSDIIEATFEFYKTKHYRPVCLPITCGSISSPMGLGSDSLPVKIKLFNKKIYLADSMQFYLEYMLRHNVDGVYYIMPSFRGEDPDKRHLNEFFHSEAEIRGNLNDVMILVEEYIRFITKFILKKIEKNTPISPEHLLKINRFVHSKSAFPKITFHEALNLLGKEKYFKKIYKDVYDINKKGERELIKLYDGPVWLTHFPKEITPFYQAVDKDRRCTLNADLLMGIGETAGCGERHKDYQSTLKSLREHQVNPSQYNWYLNLKRKYAIQTAGFGLGIERYLLWILNHHDIRDIPILPRIKNINIYM